MIIIRLVTRIWTKYSQNKLKGKFLMFSKVEAVFLLVSHSLVSEYLKAEKARENKEGKENNKGGRDTFQTENKF